MTKSKPVVYISNLPFEVTSALVADAFYAEDIDVDNVELLKKGKQGFMKSCGLAAVTLKTDEDFEKSLSTMDGKQILGRPMIVRRDKFLEDNIGYAATSAPK